MINSLNEIFKGVIGDTYKESTPVWPMGKRAIEGAPNIVFIVLDDVGFSDLGCYGSEIATPNIDAMASNGIRYNNFHVTSMCSPTRASLLSGRNAHSAGVGIIAEWANGFPSYQGRITKRAAILSEILNDHAYGCYAQGKWHLTNIADYGAAGPHDDWPLGRGFARWYGFHGALIDQWNPELYEDNHPIKTVPGENYHLSTDIVNHAIEHIRDHVTSTQDRPFFAYLAFGACHWPHHVPRKYIDKYSGTYDCGWDAVREARLKRQKALGIVNETLQLAPRNPGVEPWEEVPADKKKLTSRLQETYAAFLEHTDQEIGRFMEFLESTGHLDNTLLVLLSDNGASAEGGPTGAISMRTHFTHEPEAIEKSVLKVDKLGSEHAYNHYSMGWAQVSNTPLKWYKKDTHGGGIRAPLIIQWKKGINARGEIRSQFHHVIDIVPTILECLGASAPQMYKGVEQMPIHGISMKYTFDDGASRTRKKTQYFELLGDRAVWHEGWKAVARHAQGVDFSADRWELYKLDEDFNEINDLSKLKPKKLKAMLDLWWQEAKKYGVLPLDDRESERAKDFMKSNPRRVYEFLPDMARIDRLLVPEISDRSYIITVRLRQISEKSEGIIVSWGSRFAGFVLYVQDGYLIYEYVYTDDKSYKLRARIDDDLSTIVVKFTRTKENSGRIELLQGGKVVDSVALEKTWWSYSLTAGMTCGFGGVPVSEAYSLPFRFTGTIEKVVVELLDEETDVRAQMFQSVLTEE